MKVQVYEHSLYRLKEAAPEYVHISSLLLNANAHGRFSFVETIVGVKTGGSRVGGPELCV